MNILPETHIFVEGVVDTVPSRQVIHWWGNDPDGWVVGYYYNWDGRVDTVFTTLTCDTFILRAEDTVNFHTLKVWAEDNEGAMDATPAELTLPVRNSPPTVDFKDKSLPDDTTLSVVTFYLVAHDIDGDESVAGFYYRLDTDVSMSFIPADTPYVTLRDVMPGERTFFACAVDESNALSDTISHTWWVEQIVSDILLVDDEPGVGAGPFYGDIMESMGLLYNLWRVDDGLPYSPFDVDIMINELGFNTIIWYTGRDICHLSDAQKPIERYLDDGKNLFLVSSSALNAFYYNVDIPSAFVYNYLGVDTSTLTEDYMDNLLPLNYILYRDSLVAGYPDSLEVSTFISKFDAFEASEEGEVIYRLPESGLWEGKPGVAVKSPAQNPNLVFFSVPIDKLNGLGNAGDVVRYVLEEEFGY
ncbi:hypothetical protein CH333_05285 [candidate division WOR-3 bacterium JGI_Cruoil_03_44_89]|uniref:Uncharacterized protein n=1 Tax=candidate division WOR-3 bacterium JGI_Cruoil_03_44_89 TaxID=1973748 RepID=A0A235BTE0_UNCW3|nr:MAG: hypothetical protein CH333_05285 [candidate division WOR-3 bacterium JGI_Cruoil_03_44_89]